MKKYLLIVLCSFVLVGCSSSSRFVSKDVPPKKYVKKKTERRFSSKEVEEEKRENDKKVDVKKVAEKYKSKKNTPSEKTPPVEKEKQSPKEKSSTQKTSPKESSQKNNTTANNTIEQQKMMDAILEWIGTPYKYGAQTKSGTDCSGFTQAIFNQATEINLMRSTKDQVKHGKSISRDNLQFGDLIFFNTTGENPSHVGIYIGDDMFAHASVSSGVTLSSLYSSYYKKRYTQARRVAESVIN